MAGDVRMYGCMYDTTSKPRQAGIHESSMATCVFCFALLCFAVFCLESRSIVVLLSWDNLGQCVLSYDRHDRQTIDRRDRRDRIRQDKLVHESSLFSILCVVSEGASVFRTV